MRVTEEMTVIHAYVFNVHATTTLEMNLELRFKYASSNSRPVNLLPEVNVIFEIVQTPA